MKPSDFGFPYEDWYPYQLQNAEAIVRADEKVSLLESPTGSGKSALAITAAKLMDADRTVILCSTKQLQRQYKSDFPEVAVMTGRNNYTCAVDPDFDCSEAPCRLEGFGCAESEKYLICPYYKAKADAVHAKIACLNTSFFLYEANYVGQFSNLDFLIVDEGDLLERSLLGFASIDLSKKSFQDCDIDLPEMRTVSEVRRWARKHLPLVTRRAMEAEGAAREDMSWLSEAVKLAGHKKRLRKLVDVDTSNWVLHKDMFGYSVQPLWASTFGEQYVLRHAKKILIMSATMPPPEVYARQLGIEGKVHYIEMPSFFPKENRPINYWPITKIKGNSLQPSQLNLICNAVDLILTAFPDEKILVDTTSYKLRDAILGRTRFSGRFITHNSGDGKFVSREEALRQFISTREPKVLISPSMGRGVDLRDDLCRVVIIIKLPFKSLGDPQVRSRMERDPDWYTASTADGLVQTTGRGMRHADDYVVSFLLDQQMSWFASRNGDFFPDWWKESVHKIDSLEEAVLPSQMQKGAAASSRFVCDQ